MQKFWLILWCAVCLCAGMELADFPHLQAWFERIRARPATQRAYALGDTIKGTVDVATDAEAKRVLFGQGAVKK